MRPTHPTMLLVSSQHPRWGDLRRSLAEWPNGRIVGDVQQAAEAVALAAARQPRVILVDAEATGRPLVSLVGDLRAASPASRTMVIGARETLDRAVLVALWHRGVVGYFVWEGLHAETLLRGVVTVLGADVLVGSRVVLDALLDWPERRRRPRIAGLVLSDQERAALRADGPLTPGEEGADLVLVVRSAAPPATHNPLQIACYRRASAVEGVAWSPATAIGTDPREGLSLSGATPPASRTPPGATASPLTAREQEVLQLIEAGVSYKRIAARLHVGESTVKATVRSIKDKLDLVTREDLVAAAHRLRRR
jgi:DNA-binding NarL/FixJ family response regulator